MLVRLTGEQASRHWEFIKQGLEAALPPVVGMQSDRMSNVLTSILIGKMVIWVSVQKDKDNLIDGFAATTFTFDEHSKTKALFIYAIYGINASSYDSWISAVETLRKFGISEKCHRVLAYSNVPSIIKFVESVGGEAKYHLLSIPL